MQDIEERCTILQYADYTILFREKSVDLEVRLLRCLRIFTLISGHRVNLHNSMVVGVGMERE